MKDEHYSQSSALMIAMQVVDSKARYTNGEMNFACQIYIRCNATQLWDTEIEVQMGCIGTQNKHLEDL